MVAQEKRFQYLFLGILMLVLLSLSFISAGLFNKNKITGQVLGSGEIVVENPKDNAGNYILISKYFYGNDYTLYAGKYCEEVQDCTGFKDVVMKDDSVKACRCDDYWGCEGQSCVSSVASSSYWERVGSVTCTGCEIESACGDGVCNGDETCGDTDTDPECNSDCGSCASVCATFPCKISIDETKNAFINGKTYSISLDGLSSDATVVASLTINGKTKTFTQGQTKTYIFGSDQLEVYVKTVFRSGDDGSGYIEIFVVGEACTDTCTSLGYECGTHTICGVETNCGDANTSCIFPNAQPICNAGQCELLSCNSGYGNCDGDETNGCETDLTTAETCGSCLVSCAIDEECINGACREIECSSKVDCNYWEECVGGICSDINTSDCFVKQLGIESCFYNGDEYRVKRETGCKIEVVLYGEFDLLPGVKFTLKNGVNIMTPSSCDSSDLEIIFSGEPIVCDLGCSLEGKCYPFGYRKSGKYCSDDYEFVYQLEEDSVCENNFECESNVCVNGQCISGSLIQRIIEWFRNIFH